MELQEIAKFAAKAAAEKKAFRMNLFDLKNRTDLCQYMLIISAANDRQTRAVVEGIEELLVKEHGLKPLAIEGKQNGHWILMDYGSLIIHVFIDYIRDYYALEKLWPEASQIDLNQT